MFKNSLAFNSELGRDKGPEIHFSLYSEISDNTSAKIKGKEPFCIRVGDKAAGSSGAWGKTGQHVLHLNRAVYPVAAHCGLVFP